MVMSLLKQVQLEGLTSTVSKSSARKEIMNDGESKDGNISAESSIFRRRIADQQGSK